MEWVQNKSFNEDLLEGKSGVTSSNKVAAFKKLVVVSQFMLLGQPLNSDYLMTEHWTDLFFNALYRVFLTIGLFTLKKLEWSKQANK